jgi:hypothetical protein
MMDDFYADHGGDDGAGQLEDRLLSGEAGVDVETEDRLIEFQAIIQRMRGEFKRRKVEFMKQPQKKESP